MVDEAEDLRTGRIVAIKKAIPTSFNKMVPVLFAIEANALSRVSHPNVVGLVASGTADALPYIAMDLVQGPSLHGFALQGLQNLRTLLEISVQACQGLEALHAAGILHRDIKPANLLLDLSGTELLLKIIDLGLAKVPGNADIAKSGHRVVGTPVYIPPEQALCKGSDQRSDLFSLGIIMFEGIAGEPPIAYHGNPFVQFMMQVEEPQKDIRSLVPDLDSAIASLIMKAISKDPQERFQSAKEMREAIESCL